MTTIYLVWADRGDYSDRAEYPVCWYPTREQADARAKELQAASNEWRRRVSDANDYGQAYERGRAEVGDPGWAPYDDTDYSVVELEQGK